MYGSLLVTPDDSFPSHFAYVVSAYPPDFAQRLTKQLSELHRNLATCFDARSRRRLEMRPHARRGALTHSLRGPLAAAATDAVAHGHSAMVTDSAPVASGKTARPTPLKRKTQRIPLNPGVSVWSSNSLWFTLLLCRTRSFSARRSSLVRSGRPCSNNLPQDLSPLTIAASYCSISPRRRNLSRG